MSLISFPQNSDQGQFPTTSPFPVGTRVGFAQASAPTGWTQDASDAADNRMLRVVKTAGGGTAGTHSPILNSVVPSHTHGITTGAPSVDHTHSGTTSIENAQHTHGVNDPGHAHTTNLTNWSTGGSNTGFVGPGSGSSQTSGYTSLSATTNISLGAETANHAHSFTTGGISAAHTHSGTTDGGSSSTNWQPRYIDFIICAKS